MISLLLSLKIPYARMLAPTSNTCIKDILHKHCSSSLMLPFFLWLSPKRLHRAAKVCKLWRNITLKCRPWTPAFTAVFRTTGSEGHEAMRNLLSIKYVQEVILGKYLLLISGQKELQIERMEMSCVCTLKNTYQTRKHTKYNEEVN